MALSNWDTLSIADSTDGSLESFIGTTAEIYKNSLHLIDNRFKRDEQELQFSSSIIGVVSGGTLEICGFTIYACRGPQNSIITFVKAQKWTEEKKFEYKRMFAIGAYGFSDETPGVVAKARELGHIIDDVNYDISIGTSWAAEGESFSIFMNNKNNEEDLNT